MVFLLVACGGDNDAAPTDTDTDAEQATDETSEEASEEASEDSGEEINLVYFQPGLDQPNQMEPVEEAVARFEEANPGINVEIQTAGWDQTYQKLVTAFQGGNAPDVFYGGTRWVPAFAAMDGALPLTEYASEKIKEYHDPLQEAVQFRDEIYAIPRDFSTQVLLYRTDLIEEAPQTWDEILAAAQKVQEENDDIYGMGISGALHVSTISQFFTLLFQNGGTVFDDDGNVVINSPEAVEALTFYRDLYTEHKLTPNPIEYNREELPTLFQEGKIAMMIIGPWAQSMMALDMDNDEVPYGVSVLTANELVSDSIMISNDTEHPDAAWKLVEFLTSLEEQTTIDIDAGLVPIQKEEMEDPYFSEDPYFKAFVDSIEFGEAQPTPAVWEPFEEIVAKAVQQAINGDDPQQVLDDAAQQIKDQELEPK